MALTDIIFSATGSNTFDFSRGNIGSVLEMTIPRKNVFELVYSTVSGGESISFFIN